MPRLLLVDDNPSIHKIAETLLASSDVELISCGSGAQAMALVDQGDRFDVALLDTSMLGMDGWTLLQRLRETDATARMPVAMMAGVLDVVDPETGPPGAHPGLPEEAHRTARPGATGSGG